MDDEWSVLSHLSVVRPSDLPHAASGGSAHGHHAHADSDGAQMKTALARSLLAGAAAGLVLATSPAVAGDDSGEPTPTAGVRNGPIAFRQVDPETGLGTPLFRAEPDGTGKRALSDRQGFFSEWRPDGERIAFDFFEPDGDVQIATMTADGDDLQIITSGPGIHEVPSWSPDGSRIVFDFSPTSDPEAPGFETRLRTMRADGSDQQELPIANPGFDVEPRWSPDGQWIAFNRIRTHDGGSQLAVFVVPADGGTAEQLTAWELNAEHPTWSPDSRRILYNTPEGSIESMRADGSDRQPIAPATAGFGGHKPWMSPDGKRILFMCETQGSLPEPPADHNEDICVMDADGSAIVNLTNTPGVYENWPSWGPAQAAEPAERHRSNVRT
jgi:Tol biopolymer transport system component